MSPHNGMMNGMMNMSNMSNMSNLNGIPSAFDRSSSDLGSRKSISMGGGRQPPNIIPAHEIQRIKVLGEGTFGEVLLCEWLGTPVAVKRVVDKKPDALNDGQGSEFEQELEVLSQIAHSKIVRFLGYCPSPPSMVLEYYSLGCLDKVMYEKRLRLTVAQNTSVALDVALGMAYLHHQRILHRDIKPQNILLDDGFVGRIADFGLAKNNVGPEGVHSAGMTGTVPYMAPEILSRAPYGYAVDVYAYGVMLNEMFALQRPYDGNQVEWVMSAVLSTNLRPQLASSMPPIAAMLAQRCWATEPNNRPRFPEVVQEVKLLATTTDRKSVV